MNIEPYPNEPLSRQSVPQGAGVASERVADILAARILDGTLEPGARIKQDELADELRTSRIPVRDALRMLESRGLVSIRTNAGARVISLTRRDLEASFDVRERIEPLLLADSLSNFEQADIEHLYETLLWAEAAQELGESMLRYRAYHDASYRRHSSPFLAQIVARVWDTTHSYRLASLRRFLASEAGRSDRLAVLQPTGDEQSDKLAHGLEYRLHYEAVARRDIEGAQAALVLHIRRIRHRVLLACEALVA